MYQHKWGFNHHSVQKYGDANHQSQAEESGDSIVIPSKIEKWNSTNIVITYWLFYLVISSF